VGIYGFLSGFGGFYIRKGVFRGLQEFFIIVIFIKDMSFKAFSSVFILFWL